MPEGGDGGLSDTSVFGFKLLVANLHGQSATKGLPDIVSPDGSGGVVELLNLTK
jgi:hypothetical protein